MERDNENFRLLVNRHSKMLYAHIRSIVLNHQDTDDVLQNTFLKAWQNIGRFRGDAETSTWLFKIATNEALQHLRKQKNRQRFMLQSSEDSMAETASAEQLHIDGDSIKRKLENAMKLLSPQQRMVFSMKYLNEMKYTQIAQILDRSEGTLKAVYHQAVKKIEKYISENE
jgi:RNA polymerase sigma-70 factor (ECF subfamily)